MSATQTPLSNTQPTHARPYEIIARILSRIFVCGIAAPLLWIVCKIWFGFRIDTSYVRASHFNPRTYKGPYIVTPNHIHYLDESLVGCALWPKIPHFVTIDENFKIPVAGTILRMAQTWGLGRGITGLQALSKKMDTAFLQGHSVCIYPEGMLVPYRKGLGTFHRGPFLAAAYYHVPVVPVILRQTTPRGIHRLLHKPSFDVVVGAPLYAHTSSSTLRQASFDLMDRTRHTMTKMLHGSLDSSD